MDTFYKCMYTLTNGTLVWSVSSLATDKLREANRTILTLFRIFSLVQPLLSFPENTQMSREVIHQSGGEIRLPVHLFRPEERKDWALNESQD